MRKQTRTRATRLAANCLEAGFNVEDCCSGCQLYYNAIPIERRFNLNNMLKRRSQTHKSVRYECRKPWEIDPEEADEPVLPMVNRQLQQLQMKRVSLFVSDDEEEPKKESDDEDTEDTESGSSSSTGAHPTLSDDSSKTSDNDSVATVTGDNNAPTDASEIKRQSIAVESHVIYSKGVKFTIENVPKTHTVVPRHYLTRLKNKENTVDHMRKQFTRKRFPDVGIKTRAAIAAALASVPALALRAAQYFIPAIVAAFFFECGLFSYKNFDLTAYSRSFPSEFYFRTLMYEQASMCLLGFGQSMKDKLVFLACDKGNKKGVGHFIKMLSFWNIHSGAVEFKVLDMDASQGDTDACAEAIQYSLQKVGGIKLQGSTTDSGGGGVLDSLAASLNSRGLCNTNYKVAGCSIHTFQLTLKNPVEKVLGEGGLGARNLMQLIHAVYDMQQSLEQEEFVEVMNESISFVKRVQADADFDYGNSSYDAIFKERMEHVISFYDDFRSGRFFFAAKGKRSSTIKMMQAPVLTRWWYIGEACKYVWQLYPVILKATQIVINVYSGKPNKIASGLQPLLLEQNLFTDLALVKCYHSAYFERHMKWLQGAIDLSQLPGFQYHQMVPRYFLIRRDLETIRRTIRTTHPDFEDLRSSIARHHVSERETQRSKSKLFVNLAIESLDKHFKRWMNAQLLPAALLSEDPFALTVARVIIGGGNHSHPPIHPLERFFVSTVHGQVIDLLEFEAFVSQNVVTIQEDDEVGYDPRDLAAAHAVLGGSKPRSQKKSESNEYLRNMYLPLACHTHGVEAAVKEAKLVSPTGRHEPLRSAYAITRSHMILSAGNLSGTNAPDRSASILNAAIAQERQHSEYSRTMGEDKYKDTLSFIRKNIHQDHFKGERIGKLKASVHRSKESNKKLNAIQKQTGVDHTATVMGLIPYSSVNKNKGHEQALKEELLFRGVSFDVEKTGFMQLKKLLVDHEAARSKDAGCSAKAFKRLSNAIFVGVDIDTTDPHTDFLLAEDIIQSVEEE